MSTPAPTSDLAAVLAAVQAAVSYLGVSTDISGDESWMSCSALIADPGCLADLIRSTKEGRGTEDDAVAASLFVQSYAFRVGALVLAPYALGLSTPSCFPDATLIRIGRHRPASVALTDPWVAHRTAEQIAGELLGGHMAPLVSATAAQITVGQRLLWGNVAASCATVFRAIDGSPTARSGAVGRAGIQARAGEFFAAAAAWLDGLGSFEPHIDLAGEWRWQRTNCCLYYQCAGGSKCDDCSLTRSPASADTVPA
jgi:ferric iron reductase protein FhuF